jgi:membrane-bound lytic murein transglycosylase D
LFVLGAGIWISACAHARPATPAASPAAEQARGGGEDPASRRIAEADALLAAGTADLEQGNLSAAREAFDRVVGLYLAAPGGVEADQRLAEAYRRTLEQIRVSELEALGGSLDFAERRPDPASIDQVGEIPVSEEPASEELRRTAEEAVREEANDLAVDLNDAVLACVELYQGRLREWFGAALARGARYLPFIRATFASEGIPQDLAYVALVESAFKPTALSRARAKGVWQFVSATGKRYGLEQDWWLDERSDPEKATRAAALYLKESAGRSLATGPGTSGSCARRGRSSVRPATTWP